MIAIALDGTNYDVAADGTIYQSHRGGPNVLDKVRDIACDMWLENDHRKALSKEQRAMWQRWKDMPVKKHGDN